MSKAILVIDMPDSCDNCPLMFRHEEERCCMPEGRNSFSKKPSWCPLKSLPEERDSLRACDWEFESGYNAFLKELLNDNS
jgi:hypothetical protein